MKNTIKLFGIIALVAVIGFSMTACPEPEEEKAEEENGTLNGTWVSETDSTYTGTITIGSDGKGTIVTSRSGTLTVTGVTKTTVSTNGGDFDYVLSGNKLTLSNGTGMITAIMVSFSPYLRQK
jgi:hypothetical protein